MVYLLTWACLPFRAALLQEEGGGGAEEAKQARPAKARKAHKGGERRLELAWCPAAVAIAMAL